MRLARLTVGTQGTIMADRSGLGFLGLIFGSVTVAVMLMACAVVYAHVEGHVALDAPASEISSVSR
jgi:hypothetical protein